MDAVKVVVRKTKGGPGSGNWGHAGLPGQVGGSAPSGAGSPLTGLTKRKAKNYITKVLENSGLKMSSSSTVVRRAGADRRSVATAGIEIKEFGDNIVVSYNHAGSSVHKARIAENITKVQELLRGLRIPYTLEDGPKVYIPHSS